MRKSSPFPLWARILLPTLVIVSWLVMASIGGPYFGKISDVSSTDLATFLPESAESTKVNEELTKFRDKKTIPAIVVFDKTGQELTDEQKTRIKGVTGELARVLGVNGDVSQPVLSKDGKAEFIIVPLDSGGDFKKIFASLKAKLDTTHLPVDYKVTGAASFAHDLQGAFAGIDGTLLLVALMVVFIILLIVYRSPILPVVVLAVAMMALATAIFVVYHLAETGMIELNGQVQGILFILVIGASTDYSLLYIARYREELHQYKTTWAATKAAVKASHEPIMAAGATVAVGLMCLLFSDLGSNKALGPVGGIGVALSVVAALTLLPASLLLIGRRSFWPKKPRYAPDAAHEAYEKQHPVWKKIGGLVRRHPRRVWLASTVFLIAASLGFFQLKAEGVPQSDLILGYSEARAGQSVLDEHFAAGSGSPAYIVANQAKMDEVVSILDADNGVASVTIFANNSPSGFMPLGKYKNSFNEEILAGVMKQRESQVAQVRAVVTAQLESAPALVRERAVQRAVTAIPDARAIAEQAYPFKDASSRIVEGKVVLQATLNSPGDSLEARRTVVGIRDEIKKADPSALVGGMTAVQYDTNQASLRDQRVIIPLILFAITIILMMLLRSMVAPIILLLTTLLSFGATLGISALLFNHIWHFPGADPSVVIFGFVFLVALGIDYNIFLMTRVREETLHSGVRRGTIKGLVVTGGVITSAGVVLAATFAALGVIPILFLAQLAFIVAFGVLLDTILVRSLLVPSITLELGKRMWWPSRQIRRSKDKE